MTVVGRTRSFKGSLGTVVKGRSWLGTILTAPDKLRPLCPQKRTQMAIVPFAVPPVSVFRALAEVLKPALRFETRGSWAQIAPPDILLIIFPISPGDLKNGLGTGSLLEIFRM